MSTSLVFADNVKEGNRLYDSGKYQEALSYFMKPDAANNPATMNRIGYMYKKGLGIKENPEEAYKWYRNALKPDLLLPNSIWVSCINTVNRYQKI